MSFASKLSPTAKKEQFLNTFVIPKKEDITSSFDTTSLSIEMTNAYTTTKAVYDGYPWEFTVEPYRPTTMAITNPDSSHTYKWVVEGHVQGTGSSADVIFKETGTQSVLLYIRLESGETAMRTLDVVCKYVRREIRSLNDQDRETYLSAIAVMQRVPTEVGQAIWGDNYKSKDYFTRIHLYYGGTSDCDHWHQGAGFTTSHVAFTLEFEQSLQAINPTLTVPYWDFTLESTFYGPSDWAESPVFADDWFGSVNHRNELYTPTAGRFGYVPVKLNARDFSLVTNSYGMLRSPWNNDPTPFMTRSDHVYGLKNNLKPSGCVEYYRAFEKDTWMSFSKQLNSAAHGHIHELVGGAWGTTFGEDFGYEASPVALNFAHTIQALSKLLWRASYLKCPESCDMDASAVECECTCATEAVAGSTAKEILFLSGVLSTVEFYDNEFNAIDSFLDENGNAFDTLPGYTQEDTDEIYQKLLDILCEPGYMGDMFQATSPNDNTFWVLHGLLDRLWHWKRLQNDETFDETWDPYHTCYGHNPTNYQPFKKGLFGEDNELDVYYTNIELYDLVSPTSRTMPYMYDNFDFPHCDFLGYTMGSS